MRHTERAAYLMSLVFLAALADNTAAADEVYLKNGDRISGRLISFTPTLFTFETEYAATLRIEPGKVARVRTTEPVAITLNNGDRVIGIVDNLANGVLFIRSERFGHVTLSREEITEVVQPMGGAAAPALASAGGSATAQPQPGQGQQAQGDDRRLLAAQGRGTAGGPPQVAQQNGTANGNGNNGNAPSEPLGQEQKEEQRRIFLRESTVLLKPGEFQFDGSLSYLYDKQANALTERQVFLTPTLRVGLLDGLEGFVQVPFGWSQRELEQLADRTTFDLRLGIQRPTEDQFGLGDVAFGLKYLLTAEDEDWPDLVAALTVRAPTATGPAPDVINNLVAPLGNGRWLVTGGLTFIRSYDPAVLFGGIDYTYASDGQLNGATISGGDIFGYNFGLGFAINDQLTLSGQFLGAYQTTTRRNGVAVIGEREPMALRSSITFRFSKNQYLEPSVTYGLNSDAVDTVLNLSFVRQF